MENASAVHAWPDALDLGAMLLLAGMILSLTVAGYVFMVLDYRAYLRSLRRHLVRAWQWIDHTPDWVLRETPPCLRALGLRLPCSEDDLLRAYRNKIKQLHPDRGGDQRQFLRIQSQFEASLQFLRRYEASRQASATRSTRSQGVA